MSIKSTLFRIFKKRTICYVNWSLLYTYKKWRRYAYFLYPNDQKTDENFRPKFWNVFFECYKLLTGMKIPPFDSAWKTASDRHPFKLQKQIQDLTSLDLTWPDLDPKLGGSRASGLPDAHGWSISRKWFIEDVSRASSSSFFG